MSAIAEETEHMMQKLLKRLNSMPWEDWLDRSEVWLTRFTLTAMLFLVIGMAAQAPSEEDMLQAGLATQGQQEYWRSEAFFQQAVTLSPHDFRPLLDLARLHQLEQRYDLAQSELDMARNLQPANADIWLTLGDLAQAQGQQNSAEQDWLQATRLAPPAAQMQAHERLGLIYERQQRFANAEAHFAALPESSALAQYHLGALLLARGARSQARQAFQTVFYETDDADLRASAQAFLRALDQWDGSERSQTLIGFTYLGNNLPWLAEAPLQRSIALDPKDANAHAYLGWVERSLGNSDQAVAQERLAVQVDPGNSFANYTFCMLDLDAGHYTAAINDLETALTSDPLNPLLWATRGQIAEQLDDLPFAQTAFQHAVENAGGDPQFALLLASFYAVHQRGIADGTALQAAQEAVSLAPSNALAYDLLGRIQQQLHDLQGAMQSFAQAVALDPTSASIRLHLATIEAIQNDLRSSELNLSKVIVLDYNGPLAHQAGQLLQQLPPLAL